MASETYLSSGAPSVVRTLTSARGADGLLDHRAFGGGEVEGQTHDFQRKQQVGKDDGGVDAQSLGGGDGDFGGQRGLLADFDEGVVLADFAVLGHIAARLAHKPDRSRVSGKTFTSTDEDRIGRRHKIKFYQSGGNGACDESHKQSARAESHIANCEWALWRRLKSLKCQSSQKTARTADSGRYAASASPV